MSEPIPVCAYTFPNGMMAVFDQFGQQVPAFQGRTEECLPELRRSFPECEIVAARWDGRREHPIVVDE